MPEKGEQTFNFLDRLHEIVKKYYENNFYLVGNSMSDYDLSKSFQTDNILISILSALFLIIVLLFTFKSVGLPLLLIFVIQGSIWINFSFPYLMGSQLFFLGYLIVNAIQMGANIDYAIVISNRYSELKKKLPIDKAIIMTLNQSFPTILTSGTILESVALLIGFISTNGTISSLGICLGRGTIISMILVMCALPQILLFGDLFIEKAKFYIKSPDIIKNNSGTVMLDGHARGKISGFIDAKIKGLIKCDVKLFISSEDINKVDTEKSNSDDNN
ncbi:MAG: MMPL family transporter [Firmicutes bacterium]|nr:MMPL family transporter [Bacillota bacterium]